MKVLFVCSGNNKNFKIAPFINEQGESLKEQGIKLEYYSIIGKGLYGYLKSGIRLRSYLRKNKFDIIHAHYTLSGWAALIGAGKTPVVLSLMGDDACGTYVGINKILLISKLAAFSTKLIQPFVKAIISKSANIEKHVNFKSKSYIIPNGINIKRFMPKEKLASIDSKTENNKKKLLFLGSTTNKVKNFPLVKAALTHSNHQDVELISPYPVPHKEIPKFLNSVDVLVFPSLNEGSPNVIKEAMACNCPIVSTDVGDVKWIFGETNGCYISSFDDKEFAEKIDLALKFANINGRTNGFKRIIELGLDTDTIAKKIIQVYNKVLKSK